MTQPRAGPAHAGNRAFRGEPVMRANRPALGSASLGRFGLALALLVAGTALAQDDVTTRNAANAYGGGFIAGPAANPLSFLNGPAFRTFGSRTPYVMRDTRPAGTLNERLPSWIALGLEARLRWEREGGTGFRSGDDDAYVLNRTRFQVELRPSSRFKVVAQTQDARVFFHKPPLGPPNQVAWDLKLAYAEIGDPERDWISLRVGRQLINYNNTMISNSEWRNQGRSYDAAVANLHRGRFRAGVFAASVVIPAARGVSHHRAGNNLFGIYGTIDGPAPDSVLEPFAVWRLQPGVAVESPGPRTGKQDEKAYGIRFKGLVRHHFEYSVQAVLERGRAGAGAIRASAVTGGIAYRLADATAKPRVFWQYDQASGDKDPADGVHGTFDTMYFTSHDRFGIADQFIWQNIRSNRAGVTVEPFHRWTITAGFLDIRLASARDALYGLSGVVARDPSGRSGTQVAREIDCYSWFELNAHLNIGGGIGYVYPGTFLVRNGRGAHYAYPYVAVNFKDLGK